MKALVLSGGKGSRLRPITYSYAKQLIPIVNKPILFYVLEDLASAGISDVGIIVGATKDLIKAAVGNGENWGIKVTYIEQKSPLGLGHAVKIAQPFIGNQPFVMYLGDNILKGGIKSFVSEYGNKGEDINILLTEAKHPECFGVAELDQKGRVKKLVEKPQHFISNHVLVGVYIFNHKIFPAVDAIKPSGRGELEITDAIQYVIDHGGKVEPFLIKGWWKDTGKTEDVLEANSLLIEGIEPQISGAIDQFSKLSGRIKIGEKTLISNSVLKGPVIIGGNCLIENGWIGPFTSIGDNVQITNSKIEKSIIMEETVIINYQNKIVNSLIGRGVKLKSRQEKPAVHQLLLGDHCSLGIYE